MSGPSLLVTGASGQLGKRVVELLLERGHGSIIATTRRPDSLAALAARGVAVRAADFDDPASLATAFAGAERALLVSTDALDRPGHRLAQHRAAIATLEAAGIKHVVYTSLTRADTISVGLAPDHAGTEAALRDSRLDFTVLRNNVYTDMLKGTIERAIASGELVDARADGAVGYVTREDCARAAAAALVSGTGRRVLEITGPEAVTSAQLAILASEIGRRAVVHRSIPVEALISGMVDHGLPRPVAEIYASFDTATAKSELSLVTSAFKELTGDEPRTVSDWLRSNLSRHA
jgi:NAD(P)H dehydrogenase (quinone)